MVYIGADGNLTEDKPKYAFLEGIIRGVFGFFALLIGSITGNPNTIRANPNRTVRRNRVRGSNIRTAKDLGCADAKAGGG